MKTYIFTIFALAFPALLSAAEIKGTVVKLIAAKNQLVLQTKRGEETLETTKATKGVANAKEGAAVLVIFSEKSGDPKVSEIMPIENSSPAER